MFSRKPRTGPETAQAINADLDKAARKAGAAPMTVRELRKTQRRYPALVPVLMDWLRNLDSKTSLPDTASGNIHNMLFRTLMTPDAPSREVFSLAVAYLDSHPQIAGTVLQGASNAAGYHATPEDTPTMIRLAGDRANGDGRVWILEWLVRSKDLEAVQAAVEQLDDTSVAPLTLRELSKLRTWPDGLRARVEPLVESEHTETAKQASKLLAKLDKAGA